MPPAIGRRVRLSLAVALLALGLLPPAERAASSIATSLALPLAFFLAPLAPRKVGPDPALADSDRSAIRALLEAEARSLSPPDPVLGGRAFLHGGIRAREEGGAFLLLEVGTEDGVALGVPAIAGRALVGFVEKVWSRRSRLRTVRSEAFRAAGRLAPEGVRMVVRGTGGDLLSVEVEEPGRKVSEGEVVCDVPPLAPGEDGAAFPGAEAAGFLLGFLEEGGGSPTSEGAVGSGPAKVRAAADPRRLSSVLLLLAGGEGIRVPGRLPERAEEEGRVEAGVRGLPDLSPGRRSLLLAAGTLRGIRAGDAVVSGERLVGIVAVAGPWSARVALLGDPMSPFEALINAGEAGPIALGRLEPSGSSGGALRFGVAGGAPGLAGTVHAGALGLRIPRGLVLGTGTTEAGILLVDPGIEARETSTLEVIGGGE